MKLRASTNLAGFVLGALCSRSSWTYRYASSSVIGRRVEFTAQPFFHRPKSINDDARALNVPNDFPAKASEIVCSTEVAVGSPDIALAICCPTKDPFKLSIMMILQHSRHRASARSCTMGQGTQDVLRDHCSFPSTASFSSETVSSVGATAGTNVGGKINLGLFPKNLQRGSRSHGSLIDDLLTPRLNASE